uniref:Domain of unknown function DB domain-containing protein n=1 Tax=Panagrolaimus superbus TaxID=310955 RepID=A0A914YKP1_9BILA
MFVKFVIFAICLQIASACLGMGGCGGGCGMQQCGRYCARAKGAKTVSLEDRNAAPRNPDEEFLQCCQDRELPGACLSKCNFRSYTAASLRSMFLRLDACPIEAASALHFCATRGQDHRTCCGRNGVGSTSAGPRCFLFCDEEPRNRTQLDLTFLPCLDKFEEMKQCFWADAVNSHGYRNPLPVPARSPQRQLSSPNPYQSIYGINPQQQRFQQQQQFYNSQEQQRQQFYAPSSAGVRPLQPLAVSPI